MRVFVADGWRPNRSPEHQDDGEEAAVAHGSRSGTTPLPQLAGSGRNLWIVAAWSLIWASAASGAEFDEASLAFRTGQYAAVLKSAEEATDRNYAEARWWRLRLDCLAALGRYRDGAAVVDLALKQHPADAPIRVASHDLLHFGGRAAEARASLEELLRSASTSPWRFSSPVDRTAVGRAAMLMGGDAREVLEGYYDPALKTDPDLRDVYLAVGELALAKNDLAVAADNYRAALEKFPGDPDFLYGLARAVEEESDAESRKFLAQALEKNPRHLEALWFTAEEALAHEDYAAATAALDRVSVVNPRHPRTWALRAVAAHLQADSFGEWFCRECALDAWADNPEVDHLIGAKLSRAYRFAEGAAYQRRALAVDSQFLPARKQLASDLLRLGEVDEGWRLVGEVQAADPYDVPAYNLATLKDRLNEFVTLESPQFRLHMERREAAVYGDRVMALLERARTILGEKYGWMPARPVTVEVLTRQQDFAIRTFGLPGGDGILGVCFGYVITANSPAALAGQNTNWQATLWHEYCHVVTLGLTQHRIPRWLSEGISVYEERQADSAWGDRIDRNLRKMILDGEMTPVSRLNEAFRSAKSAAHFNLAYYQSSLAVEYFVDTLGHAALRRLLDDVAAGVPINDALELRTGSLNGFEQAFDKFARARAADYGLKVDWSDDELASIPKGPAESISAWLEQHPNHYLGRLRFGRALLDEKRHEQAAEVLKSLTADVPQWAGDESPYALLAEAYRGKGDTTAERRTLEDSASRSDDALETFRRLIELAITAGDDDALHTNVERYLEVRPLDEFPYRSAAEHAGSARSENSWSAAAARSLIALEPEDRSGAHLLLARRLHALHDPQAKRHALLALEETPRFRDAQQLLLQIVDAEKKPQPPTTVSP